MIIIGLDLGTTGIRAIAFRSDASIAAKVYQEIPIHCPQAGWVEQDPMQIWDITVSVLRELASKVPVSEWQGLGISNQRETTILWDAKTGLPLYPAISWQCRRTASRCDELADDSDMIKSITGLRLDAYFSATKIEWILENVPETTACLARGDLRFGTVDSWVLWKANQGKVHATDLSNASRTMLLNIQNGSYDETCLDLFGVPRDIVPELRDSAGDFGAFDASILGKELPIYAVLGDQQAALFGQGIWEPGALKATYGTGLFCMGYTGPERLGNDALLDTIAWKRDGQIHYAWEGSAFIAGAAIQWCRDQMGWIQDAAESSELAASAAESEGLLFNPGFCGLGAPFWVPEATAGFTGIRRDTSRSQLIRAVLESVAFQCKAIVDVADLDENIVMKVDGGMTRNQWLMQFQATLLGRELQVPDCQESTCLGAAAMAGMYCGLSNDVMITGLKNESVDPVGIGGRSHAEAKYERWLAYLLNKE